MLLLKLWVSGIFYPILQDSVKHLSQNGQQCYTSAIGAGAEITIFGKLDEVTLLPLCWYLFLFPDLIERRVKQLNVCPVVDLQFLCQDVRSCSLAISQLLDSILNLLLSGCTTVNG